MKTDQPLTPSEKRWSYSIWALWLLAFLGFEFGGLAKRTPWRTLSETSWSLEGRWCLLKIAVDGGLEILRTHILNPYWPGKGPKGDRYTVGE